MNPSKMTRSPWQQLAVLASVEHGALLWLPVLLFAVALTLFAMRVAPAGVSLFTRTTSLRIALGGCVSEGASASETATFVGALRQALAARGELSLVDSLKVARRLATLASPEAAGIPDSLLRAVRPLNPHLAVCMELERTPKLLRAHVEAWDVHDQRRILEVEARSGLPETLARVVAESLSVGLLAPRPAAAVHR